MPAASGPVVVTGSSGFIGGHFCAAMTGCHRPLLGIDRLPALAGVPPQALTLDLACGAKLESAAAGWQNGRLLHLAADAEVVLPWAAIPGLFSSNLLGTWNALNFLKPRLCVFASSSSVYGNATLAQTDPDSAAPHPLGVYAHSKSAAEVMLRDWAEESDASAVSFRFGNVIGPRCRGLIPFLVNHAVKHPDGSPPAPLRGEGCLVRDYIPVRFVADVLAAALAVEWKPGAACVFNIGTGRGLTNRAVTEIVASVLDREGYRLRADYSNPVPAGEALSVVLDCRNLVERFAVDLPEPEEVEQTIKDAVLCHLGSLRG